MERSEDGLGIEDDGRVGFLLFVRLIVFLVKIYTIVRKDQIIKCFVIDER